MSKFKIPPKNRTLKEEHIIPIIDMYMQGKSLPEITKHLNLKRYQPISKFLEYNNIRTIYNRKDYFDKRRKTDKLDKNLVLKLIEENRTRKEIADIYETNIHIIKRFLKRNNIRITNYENKKYKENLIMRKNEIIELYEKYKRLKVVADKFNCSSYSLREFFRSIGYNYKRNNHIDLAEHLENIKHYYYNENKKLSEIGHIYNCSSVKIRDFMIKNNFVMRDKTELLKERNKSESFQRKCLSGSGRKKDYTLPSGKIIKLRGYEPNFLTYIFSNNLLEENEIIYSPPRIQYSYNNKEHHYYPDFFIPKFNLIIETKSSWILKKQGREKNIEKEKATISKGYNFLLIIDNNFQDIKKILEF